MAKLSAYLPCYNSASTIQESIESIRRQTVEIDDLFVVDDASDDGSQQVVESIGVRLIRHSSNMGRGAVRNRAMLEAREELVLSLDSNKTIEPQFVEKSLKWFEDNKVAGVFGRISHPSAQSVAERWQSRHLYKNNLSLETSRQALLSTYGAIVRKSHCLEVENYNKKLRAAEDRDLGERLLRSGYDVVFDPSVRVEYLSRDSLASVLERYHRWYAAGSPNNGLIGYARHMAYSLKCMALEDIRQGDPFSAVISLLAPHYQFWRLLFRRNN